MHILFSLQHLQKQIPKRINIRKRRGCLLSFIYAKITSINFCYNIYKSVLKQTAQIKAIFIYKTQCTEFANICKYKKLLQTGRRLKWEKQWDMHE